MIDPLPGKMGNCSVDRIAGIQGNLPKPGSSEEWDTSRLRDGQSLVVPEFAFLHHRDHHIPREGLGCRVLDTQRWAARFHDQQNISEVVRPCLVAVAMGWVRSPLQVPCLPSWEVLVSTSYQAVQASGIPFDPPTWEDPFYRVNQVGRETSPMVSLLHRAWVDHTDSLDLLRQTRHHSCAAAC